MLWFPRSVGNSRVAGHQIDGGVRWLMPDSEYSLNPNLTEADRATGCSVDQRLVNF